MKKFKKKDILETIDLLIEGNNFVAENCYQTRMSESMPNILQQCQEMAIALGNCLETLGTHGEVYIPVLEDYCERVYHINQNLADINVCRNIAETTVKQLSDLRSDIICRVPNDKLEVVFLPYKVSMWDSLESVWRAAAEDPECDAYVVPIPYYDRNLQGELAVMHYEGEQFPKDVPVVHYMDYNLAERRPDVAFIHNPYDQYNYVTSIHPGYYVPELKKYVGKVAYIPYFVSPEPNPGSLEEQEQKRGFVVKPGVTDTDLVFVQSEDMKRLYVNILEKEIPNVSRKYWEDKIFGLGSPKLDRVHSVKRNDDLLSGKWHSIIYDGAGNRKKVIFYNTSLHDLLNQENMMEKIADTLTFFRERKDCALWWRPHPLYESTLASMRPEWLSTYKKIVEEYITEGWGIFDTGEDLDWAIAETDAYYGDGSSVVQLYKEAGKPVLYQDTRVKNSVEKDVEIPIWPCAFCVDGDDIWFVHGKMNLLMKYNKRLEKIEVIESIPNEYVFQETLYQTIYKNGDKIYLIPTWAAEIAIYDIKKSFFNKIELRKAEEYINKLKFGKCVIFEHTLYCIPYYYGAIVKINLNTQEITYINLEVYLDKGESLYIGDGVLINKSIVGPWNLSNRLFVLDLKSEKIKFISIGEKERQYSKINKVGKNLALYDEKYKNIVYMSIRDWQINNIINAKFQNSRLSVIDEKILLIDASDSEQRICLDEYGIVKYESIEQTREKSTLENSYYFGVIPMCGSESAYFDTTNYLLYILKGTDIKEQINMKSLRLVDDIINKLIGHTLKSIQYENDVINLNAWISQNMYKESALKGVFNSGEKIKNLVKEI